MTIDPADAFDAQGRLRDGYHLDTAGEVQRSETATRRPVGVIIAEARAQAALVPGLRAELARARGEIVGLRAEIERLRSSGGRDG